MSVKVFCVSIVHFQKLLPWIHPVLVIFFMLRFLGTHQADTFDKLKLPSELPQTIGDHLSHVCQRGRLLSLWGTITIHISHAQMNFFAFFLYLVSKYMTVLYILSFHFCLWAGGKMHIFKMTVIIQLPKNYTARKKNDILNYIEK